MSQQLVAVQREVAAPFRDLTRHWSELSHGERAELLVHGFCRTAGLATSAAIHTSVVLAAGLCPPAAAPLFALDATQTSARWTLRTQRLAPAEARAAGERISKGLLEETNVLAREAEATTPIEPVKTWIEQAAPPQLKPTVAKPPKYLADNPTLLQSWEKFKNAEQFLRQHRGFMPEVRCRELIQSTGIQTFPRPKGIPETFRVRISNDGAGIIYVHPDHTHTSIRVMPGKPHSSFPYQQKPYVIQMKNGKIVDKLGHPVSKNSPEAHIPFVEFTVNGELLWP